jgi:hypothetical protein
MSKVDVSLIQQGSFVHVAVDYMGKKATKELKVCRIKARSILLIEVDKPNRKNIFRKVNLKDIDLLTPTQLHVKKDILPTKWESEWDSIGSPTFRNYGRMAQAAKPFYSKHSQGWAPKLPPVRSTTNSAAGFPMV